MYQRFELDTEKLSELLLSENLSLAEYAKKIESSTSKTDIPVIEDKMLEVIQVMENASKQGRNQRLRSVSGLTGGDAYIYEHYLRKEQSLLGKIASGAAVRAISCSEWNASMQRVVACPTAGSCGIVPAVIFSIAKEKHFDDTAVLNAFFTASAIGILIGTKATLAGAEGGCQAECGAASAMAAAAAVEMMGGSPIAAMHAAAMAIKNLMGLVCDPVAGLVEIPCIKRNAGGTAIALLSADMALSGVESKIPLGEVIDAMGDVGHALPDTLRETALGGLAVTPTALKMKEQVLDN